MLDRRDSMPAFIGPPALAELRNLIINSSTVLSFSERAAALAALDTLESILDGCTLESMLDGCDI